MVSFLIPSLRIVWHDHFGRHAAEKRPAWVFSFRLAASRVQAVISVSQALAHWANVELGIAEERIHYIPNFAIPSSSPVIDRLWPPGKAGLRVICVANIRREKDHLTLVQAFARVVKDFPECHLLVAGSTPDETYLEQIKTEIWRLDLAESLSLLGTRTDVFGLLQLCDVAVLSSVSEGLPLALLEYGLAGLPVVVTNVGECSEIVDEGRAGLIVPPESPEALAGAITSLLANPAKRAYYGERLKRRVESQYGATAIIDKISRLYDCLLVPDAGFSMKVN